MVIYLFIYILLYCVSIYLNVIEIKQYCCYCFQITINTDTTVNVTCRRDGECNADKVHACGINKIKESEKLIKFVNCSLTEGFNSPNKTIPIEVVYAFI